jgi:periplasmic divalent cation tolerance protein
MLAPPEAYPRRAELIGRARLPISFSPDGLDGLARPMSVSPPTLRLVLTSVEGDEAAHALAEGLVRDRLAACASVLGPGRSFYVWEGRLERASEWVLLLKTREERLEALKAALAARHPYAVPEILTLPPLEASLPYAAWAEDVLGAGTDGGGETP